VKGFTPEGILSDYTPDAILFLPTGPCQGLAAIQPVFQSLFAEFAQLGTSFRMQRVSVEGEYAYLLWSAETADNLYEMATDTFVVRDGKIMAQSYAAQITPKRS
jgi:ketosteroid isomerase-like protein